MIYSIPIAFRYSTEGKAALEIFDKCLDLANPPVFECDPQRCPTSKPDRVGRYVLQSVIEKRLAKLGDPYQTLFQPAALALICEKSGGVMRDLIRLARTACEIALERKLSTIPREIAEAAVREERKSYSIQDYHFPILQTVHQTGQQTSATQDTPKGKVVVFEELLQYKLVLGYEDPRLGRWFDVNPMLIDDLEGWQATQPRDT